MRKHICRLLMMFILCGLLLCMSGCTIELPVYWQNRCQSLDFNTDIRKYNLSWEETRKISPVFMFFPDFNTENTCIELNTLYYKAVRTPKETADEIVVLLTQNGFSSSKDNYKNKFYANGYQCSKTICDDFNGKPVLVRATIRFNEYEFKEQYNLCVKFDFSEYKYEQYLKETLNDNYAEVGE